MTTALPGEVVLWLCRLGSDDVPADVEHHELWLIDDTALSVNPNLDFILRDAAEAIVRWREAGREVLVHCAMGESRTPTVAAAYLCTRFGISSAEALERLNRSLRRSRPNGGFRATLAGLWP